MMGGVKRCLLKRQGFTDPALPALAADFSARQRQLNSFGGDSDRVIPVPIPNTEVKPVSADGTWDVSPWESRTPPDFS